jgi:1-acyl-sn-glycerol-3-phosphate acyltransferase
MSLSNRLVIAAFRALTNVLCRIDDTQLTKVPAHGPLILITNHINLVEIPVLYTRLQPRPLTGFAAEYRWDHPFYRWLLQACDAIPLHRGEADISAMRIALEKLAQGSILAMAPEGTRSHHGRLQRGHPGAVVLALRSGAPLQPLVFYGNEHFDANLRRLRKTDFHIIVGERFTLDPGEERVTRQVRREMIDAVMVKLAALLPEDYRGVYADLDTVGEKYIRPWS